MKLSEIKEVLIDEGVLTKEDVKEIETNAKARYNNLVKDNKEKR